MHLKGASLSDRARPRLNQTLEAPQNGAQCKEGWRLGVNQVSTLLLYTSRFA